MGVFVSKEKNLGLPDSSLDQQDATATKEQNETPSASGDNLPNVPAYVPTAPDMEDEPLPADDIPIIPVDIPEKIESPIPQDKSLVPTDATQFANLPSQQDAQHILQAVDPMPESGSSDSPLSDHTPQFPNLPLIPTNKVQFTNHIDRQQTSDDKKVMNQYIIEGVIGDGQFATVRRVVDRKTNQVYVFFFLFVMLDFISFIFSFSVSPTLCTCFRQ